MYKTDTEFPGVGCPRHWHPTSICQAAPGSPGLDSVVDGNWTLECTNWNLDQDRRHGPLQKLPMDKESEPLVIPQL